MPNVRPIKTMTARINPNLINNLRVISDKI
jgi:hypothetical protein